MCIESFGCNEKYDNHTHASFLLGGFRRPEPITACIAVGLGPNKPCTFSAGTDDADDDDDGGVRMDACDRSSWSSSKLLLPDELLPPPNPLSGGRYDDTVDGEAKPALKSSSLLLFDSSKGSAKGSSSSSDVSLEALGGVAGFDENHPDITPNRAAHTGHHSQASNVTRTV